MIDDEKFLKAVLTLLILLLSYGYTNAQVSEAEWKKDIDYLESKILEDHLEPFKNLKKEDFDTAISTLRSNISRLEEHQIIAEIAKIMSLFKWGHTRLTLPVNYDHLGFYQSHSSDKGPQKVEFFKTLPVRFYLFDDGLFIQSSTEAYSEYIGAEILNIDGATTNEALTKLKPYLAVENESATKLHSAVFMSVMELLHAARISDNPDSVTVRIRTLDGEVKIIEMKPVKYNEDVVWLDWHELKNTAKPLWLKGTKSGILSIVDSENYWNNQEQYYWLNHLPESKSLYLKINYIWYGIEQSLTEFMAEAINLAENNKVEKLILDLRHNSGGGDDLNKAIVSGLTQWSGSKDFGRIYVILGRKTFSAAILLALKLEEHVHVSFVGEELGGRTEHIGDSRKFELPNSGLTIRVSTKMHRDWTRIEGGRSSVWVHHQIPYKSSDYLEGRDPVLEFIFEEKPPTDLSELAIEQYDNVDVNVSLNTLYQYAFDVRTAEVSIEKPMNDLAYHILNEGEVGLANIIYSYNLQMYPTSRNGLAGKIYCYIKLENFEDARSTLAQFKRLYPEDSRISDWENQL